MQKKIQLAIPKPCHEKWSEFTPTSQGGFCSSCQKEVIDFTNWSEEQLKTYFQKPLANSCGRFKEQQLKVYTIGQTHSSVSWGSFVFASVLLLFSSRQVDAQVSKPKVVIEEVQRNVFMGDVMVSERDSAITISGSVTYRDDGSLLPGVNVTGKSTLRKSVTDADGRFQIVIENPSGSDTLVFSFIGMKNVEYAVRSNQQEINVVMENDVCALEGTEGMIVAGGIVFRYPWYSPRRWWSDIRSLF